MQGYQKTGLTFFTFFKSTSAWRVRIQLHHKKLSVQNKCINLAKGQQKSQQFAKVNPNQAIPAILMPDGKIIVESVAICQYLEEAYPENPMLPKDLVKRAEVRGFCQIINSAIHPYQNQRVLKQVESKGVDKMQFATQCIERGTAALQNFLKKSKGKYCFGDEVTLADAFFIPHIMTAINRYGLKIDNYPLCKEVMGNLQKLDQFKKSLPKNQQDFVE